jgi:hypothetical protein
VRPGLIAGPTGPIAGLGELAALAVLVAILGVVVIVVAGSPANAAGRDDDRVSSYRPPVVAPVVDPFRPPAGPYAPGNRGLEYATVPGTPVTASGDGTVVFAGAVGGSRHVTVGHADGLRTSYSFLAEVSVRRGQRVRVGEVIGVAGERVHFGVRDPADTYLDPALLLEGRLHPAVHLVTDAAMRPEAAERRVLAQVAAPRRWVSTAGLPVRGGAGGATGSWAARVAIGLPEALAVEPPGSCTGPEAPVPPRPPGRRVLVLVGGLGSTSEQAAIDRLDVTGLGYDPGDVVRFSYAGGRVPRRGDGPVLAPALTRIEAHPYGATDTLDDLTVAGDRLGRLLDEIGRLEPGVAVDVVAHSQGGVVARLALTRPGGPPAPVATLVTLGSPHEGADLASTVAAARGVPGGVAAVDAVRARLVPDLDPARAAVAQLAEGSPLQVDLAERSLPAGVRAVSVAARGDLVVTSPRTRLPGAASASVPLVGLHAHDELPAAPATTREVALAVAGAPPTCRGVAGRIADLVVGEGIATATDALAPGPVGVPARGSR